MSVPAAARTLNCMRVVGLSMSSALLAAMASNCLLDDTPMPASPASRPIIIIISSMYDDAAEPPLLAPLTWPLLLVGGGPALGQGPAPADWARLRDEEESAENQDDVLPALLEWWWPAWCWWYCCGSGAEPSLMERSAGRARPAEASSELVVP